MENESDVKREHYEADFSITVMDLCHANKDFREALRRFSLQLSGKTRYYFRGQHYECRKTHKNRECS